MMGMNPLSALNTSECLEVGQTYMIQSAKKIHTEEGLRLFVSLRKRIYPDVYAFTVIKHILEQSPRILFKTLPLPIPTDPPPTV
jgi:hypothetical protein